MHGSFTDLGHTYDVIMIRAIAYLSHRQLVDKLNATSNDVVCLGSE